MKYFLFTFLVVLVYRILFCISGYIRTVYYEKKYDSYIFDKDGTAERFSLYVAPTQKLFRQARISAPMVPFCKPLGYGKVLTTTVSVFDNMTNKQKEIISNMKISFLEAKGYFRMSFLECFSPLYWIQLLIFLPARLFQYLGIPEDKLLPKISQLIYWVSAPLLIVFRTQIYAFILQLIQNV